MYGLESIEECEEPEEDSFLMVRRPCRRSYSLMKRSTPAQPEESHFTICSGLAGTETTSSDFSPAARSRRASPGRDHPAPLPSVEEGGDSERSHSISSPHLPVDMSRLAQDGPDANKAEDAVMFPRQRSEEIPSQSVSTSLIYDALEDSTDTSMDVSVEHRKSRQKWRKGMRSVNHELPPKMKKRAKRDINQQRRIGYYWQTLEGTAPLTKGPEVPEWLITVMKDIEEATKYELVIE